MEGRNVPESSTSSMELSSQRGEQQRQSSFTYQQLGHSQSPQGVCQQQKGKNLSESYLTLNNNNDILSDNSVSSGEEQKEIEGGGRHFFQLLNKSKAGQLQNFPGHLSQGFEVDQRNEKLGPSTSKRFKAMQEVAKLGKQIQMGLDWAKSLDKKEMAKEREESP